GRDADLLETLLDECNAIAEKYTRDREEKFETVEDLLNRLYRRVCEKLINKAFPLVIVDEAHNWKHGPKRGSNGYGDFQRVLAPRIRRALLLTATPFQLRPDE